MSSYKVYSGMPFKYKARKSHYWDKIYTGSINENTTMNVELEPYAGLTITAEPNNLSYIINASEGELPDYSYFDGVRGILSSYPGDYLLKVGSGYEILPGILNNATMHDIGIAKTYNAVYKDGEFSLINQDDSLSQYMWVGSINVPAHTPDQVKRTYFSVHGDVTFDWTIANFGPAAYIEANKNIPDEEYLKLITRVTPNYVSGAHCFTQMSTATFGTRYNNWYIYNGGSHTGGSFTAGTTYWVQVVQEKTVTKLYYMVDDGTYPNLSSLPDVTNSAWTLGVTVYNISFAVGSVFRMGIEMAGQEFGTIDLDNTVLMIPDTWFYPSEGDPTPRVYKEYWKALS